MNVISDIRTNEISRRKALLIIVPAVLLAFFTCFKPGIVHAYAEDIGTVTVDGGSPTTYSDFEKGRAC